MSRQKKRSEFVCYHGALHDREQARTGHWEHLDVSRWPGCSFGPLPCVYFLIIIIIIIFNFKFFFAFPMCQSDHF